MTRRTSPLEFAVLLSAVTVGLPSFAEAQTQAWLSAGAAPGEELLRMDCSELANKPLRQYDATTGTYTGVVYEPMSMEDCQKAIRAGVEVGLMSWVGGGVGQPDAQREQPTAYQQPAAPRQQQAAQARALAEAQRLADWQRQQLRNAEIANAVGDLATGVFSMFEKSPAERLAELQAERRAAEYRASRIADIGRRRAELADRLNAIRSPAAAATTTVEAARANYDLAAARVKVAELRAKAAAKAAEVRNALVNATSSPQAALAATVMSGTLAAATVTSAPLVSAGALAFGAGALYHMLKNNQWKGPLNDIQEGVDRFFEAGRRGQGER